MKHLCLGFVSAEESAAVLTPVCTFINLCGTVHVHTLPLGSAVDAESSHASTAVQEIKIINRNVFQISGAAFVFKTYTNLLKAAIR